MQKIMNQNGFHLIEILIVLAIITISSHWILGNYEVFITIQHRKSAQSALYQLALALEEYALENQTYANATFDALKMSSVVVNRDYHLTIDTADDFGFMISARPQSSQIDRDKVCGVLRLTSEGDKFASGTEGSHCWEA